MIGSPAVLSSTISYTQAFNGPNIGGTNPSGYTPKTFDPSANGDYYIEIYTSATAGASSNLTTTNIWSTFWDFTVGEASGVTHPGRVFSQNWNFRATAPTDSPAYSGGFDTKISPAFYSYTNDQTVVKVQFTDFQPLGFNPAFNSYGVNPSETNWLVGRKSFSQGTTIPALTNSFKTFLSSPDPGVFPVAALAAAPTLSGNVQGCAPNYNIPYNTSVLGDVRFLLDLNGVAGYQANSMDRVLEALNVPAGSNLMPWDGKDGLGNVLPPNTNVITTISVLRGRVNIPLYDAELNQQGFTVSSISPQSSTAIKLFWDDASTTTISGTPANNSNLTTGGIDNSFLGQTSPAHAWNGNYGTSLIVPPAPDNGGGASTPTDASDDYGNLRIINSWFWAVEESSSLLNLRLPYCLDVSGNVFNDPNGINNGFIDGTGTNFGGLYAYLINTSGDIVSIATVASDGSYIFNNIDSGDYTVMISTTTGTVGNPAPAIAFPTGFGSVGEGTIVTGDGTADGQTLITVVSSSISNVNFGLNNTPNSNNASTTVPNPTGTNTVTVPTLSGSDTEDGSLGATNTIIIKSLPANGTLYYNGTPVTLDQIITNYNPTLLTIDPAFPSVGTVTFDYAFIDNTGLEDTTPATVTIDFTNNPPVATDDTNAAIASTAGASPINALAATDTDG
ncbi:hypothetical protein EGI22_15275 [Lacihabitans sp. LS3-19]|nr:hypothetical protein [Lacihabitans sp. LS3-19]